MVKACGTTRIKWGEGENFPDLRTHEDPDFLRLWDQVTYPDGGETSKFVIQYEIMRDINKR